MTISSEVRKAGAFIGTGTTSVFPFAFKIFQASELAVYRTTPAGVDVLLTLGSDYSVALNSDQNSSPGGTITLLGGNLASGYKLTATSSVANLQQTDLTNQGAFYPSVITNALDKLTILVQQLKLSIASTINFPLSDPAGVTTTLPSVGVRAGKVLTFDSTGSPAAAIAAVDVSTVAAIAGDISTVSTNIGAVNTNSTNITAINTAATNIASINAAPAAATAAAASAANSSTFATNSSNSATSAAASAAAAAGVIAAAGLPSSVVGHAKEFLQVKTNETGYDLVKSVAAPTFYGFNLSGDKQSLNYDASRAGSDAANYATWTMSENVQFQVVNNQLAMVLL
jgi:hypothetical protein